MKTNNSWVAIIVIIVIIALAYIYRSQIMMMFTGKSVSTVYNTAPTSIVSVTPTNSDIIITKTDYNKGNYLAAGNGMTLYIFDKDNSNVSNCSGTCATIWPAYTTSTIPDTLPANLTVFKLPNGMMQYAYNQKPLYFYSSDKNIGDVLGDGVGGFWHLAKP